MRVLQKRAVALALLLFCVTSFTLIWRSNSCSYEAIIGTILTGGTDAIRRVDITRHETSTVMPKLAQDVIFNSFKLNVKELAIGKPGHGEFSFLTVWLNTGCKVRLRCWYQPANETVTIEFPARLRDTEALLLSTHLIEDSRSEWAKKCLLRK